jgi:hypothetical protein
MTPFQRDLLERAGWTFVQAACAAAIVAPKLDANAAVVAGLAGLAAVLSVLKSTATAQLRKRKAS